MPADAKIKSPARAAFFAVVGITVLAIGAFFNLRTDDPARAAALVTDPDFLAGLRDQPEGDGCIALQSIDDIDVLVIGSSHVGAGVDPLILATEMDGQQTGVCAIPAWTMGHFDLLFEFLHDEGLAPDRLVWIADIGTIMDLPQSQQSLASAEQIFASNTVQRRVRDRWFGNVRNEGSAFDLDQASRAEHLAAQTEALAGVELATLTALLDSQPPADLVRLGRALSASRALARPEEGLADICEAQNSAYGRLDIILSPIPERTLNYLSALEGTEYPQSLAAFAALLEQTLPCASSLQSNSLGEWGLDERHFINRSADTDYPYEVWESADAYQALTADLSRRQQRRLYDSNHLNLAGAEIFTRELVKHLSAEGADQP